MFLIQICMADVRQVLAGKWSEKIMYDQNQQLQNPKLHQRTGGHFQLLPLPNLKVAPIEIL